MTKERAAGAQPIERLTPEQVAEELQVSVKTVYTWMQKRYFRYSTLGKHARIARPDLEAWIESQTN